MNIVKTKGGREVTRFGRFGIESGGGYTMVIKILRSFSMILFVSASLDKYYSLLVKKVGTFARIALRY